MLSRLRGLLLDGNEGDPDLPAASLGDADEDEELTPSQAYCLYASHLLSMWNSRAYEYGSVSAIPLGTPRACSSISPRRSSSSRPRSQVTS